MFGPSQVSVNDGLTLAAQRNRNAYSGTYPWLSGAVTTEGKFSLPATGWYVQAKIRVPDMTQGMWPSMWFLPSQPGTPFNEIDFVQGGFTEGGGPVNRSPLATGYFPTGQSKPVSESNPDLGFDATARYHTYGVQWKPGVGINGFVDGKLVWTVTQAQVPGGIVAQPYEIVLSLQVATASDSAFHTLPTATSPGGAMRSGGRCRRTRSASIPMWTNRGTTRTVLATGPELHPPGTGLFAGWLAWIAATHLASAGRVLGPDLRTSRRNRERPELIMRCLC